MYKYPLTFTFPLASVTPQITVKDASGQVLLQAAKKLVSSKEEIYVTAGGQPRYTIFSQESRITDIPSNWDVKSADGQTLCVVDDDFISAIDTSKFMPNSAASTIAGMEMQRALNLRSVKMYWVKDTQGKKLGLVVPEPNSLAAMELPLGQFVRKLPFFFFRLITPAYHVRLGEETVMFLKKQRTFLIDTYTLESRGKFSEAQEAMLVNAVLLALVYERQHLKEMYA